MGALQPRVVKVLDGEIVSGEAFVIVAPHPFRSHTDRYWIPAGASLGEIVRDRASSAFGGDWHVCVDGEPVPEEWWDRVRVKPGVVVTCRARVGKDKALIRTALMAAIAVAALVVSGPIAGAFVPLALQGTWMFTAAKALVSLAIVSGGMLAVNALFPIVPAQLDEGGDKNIHSIAGAQNDTAQYAPVPVVLGIHRMAPFNGASQFTEIVGDDQYLRCLFVWGYGELDISAIKLGDTLLSSFEDVEVETRPGSGSDDPITLYPSDVFELPLSVALETEEAVFGFFTPDASVTWNERTTGTDIDEISVDITAPAGVYQINKDSGNTQAYNVFWRIQYRAVGETDWTTVANDSFSGRFLETKRKGRRWTVERGPAYEVRVGRTTVEEDDDNDKIVSRIQWTALRTFTDREPINFDKPLARTAIRIKASGQLSGVIDTLNGIVGSVVASFDGSTRVSNNPADLIRHVLQTPGHANERPVADEEIDLANLAEFYDYCEEEGWTFNMVRTERTSVEAVIDDICAAARAVRTYIDGKWGVLWDRPGDPIAQHFTPRNSWDFAGSHPYAHLPHAWRARFIDETNDYVVDERVVYDDGFDASNATLFEGIEFPGVTKPENVWRHGRFHIAQARLQPETFTLTVGWENIICTRGDRVHVTSDVAMIGIASARVHAISGQQVTLDESFELLPATQYAVRFRTADPSSIQRAVDEGAGFVNADGKTTITLIGDLSAVEVGMLASFGVADQESAVYRVKEIRHQRDLIATLMLVVEAPGIALADQGTIPDWVPNITIPPDPHSLVPRDLRFTELIVGTRTSARAVARLTWQVPRFGNIRGFEVQKREDSGDWLTPVDGGFVEAPKTTTTVPIDGPGLFEFRVRTLFKNDTVSAWTTSDARELSGLLAAPANVANFRATFISGRSYLTWDQIDDPREIFYEVRKGGTQDSAVVVGEALAGPPLQTVGDDDYWVAAYVVSPFGERTYSPHFAQLTVEDSVLTDNVVVSNDERADLWPGDLTGTLDIDVGQNFVRTTRDYFVEWPHFLGVNVNDGAPNGGVYVSATIVDAGRLSRCRVSVDYQATGVPETGDFLGDPDLLNNPDFLQAFLTQYVRAFPIIRVSPTDDEADFGEWNKWTPDVYIGRLFQLGMVLEVSDEGLDAGAIAYLTHFVWTIDVPDRLDRYQNLTIPVGGLTIEWEYGGYDTTPTGVLAPFNGGPSGATVPHVMSTFHAAPSDRRVVVENVTASDADVFVRDAAGVNQGGSGVQIFAQGY